MLDKNICKFVVSPNSNWLTAINFIYETDVSNMSARRPINEHRLMLIIQGSGRLSVREASFALCPGNLVFFFEGETFSITPEDALEYMYISFNGTHAEELFQRFGISKDFRLFSSFEGLIPIWKTALSRTQESNIDLAALSMVFYTFSMFETREAERNKVIQQIIDYTEKQFTSADLSIGLIAHALGYNSKYLSHLFKTHMGLCYSDYLRNKRMEYAVFLFDHGLDSVKNVAILSGFRDPLYFSSVFKKVVGVSPTDYISGEFTFPPLPQKE